MTQADNNEHSYSQITGWRPEFGTRFGPTLKLPVARSPYEVCRRAYTGGTVLDIGAGVDKPLATYLDLTGQNYHSVDTDPAASCDFRSIEEVPASSGYDLIVLNQVLEHLTVSEALGLLRCAGTRLVDGGTIVASVPNMQHPVRYWGDATHVTPWPVDDFYGLFKCADLDVKGVFRSGKRHLSWNPIVRYLTMAMCRQFRVDWCDTTIISGGRPEPT